MPNQYLFLSPEQLGRARNHPEIEGIQEFPPNQQALIDFARGVQVNQVQANRKNPSQAKTVPRITEVVEGAAEEMEKGNTPVRIDCSDEVALILTRS